MCGFCGFTGQIASPEEILESMKNKIIHRGPDSDGSHLDDGIAMGFRRLSFVDLEGGSQPIYNETRDMVITFNGEIYNHRELREELEAKGHVMGSRADTEVLIHGYEEWGEELLQKLRGMFAFVIWDKKNKSIFGARDFFGIKPFYYTIANGNLIYGSEIKAILAHPDVKRGQSHCTGKLSDLPVQRSGGNLLQRHFQADACALLHLQGRQNGYQTLLGACV